LKLGMLIDFIMIIDFIYIAMYYNQCIYNHKLGDFGCCMKLKNHSTMPGELCTLVGTASYMAPGKMIGTQIKINLNYI
jgi:serine/threonine protein kinase